MPGQPSFTMTVDFIYPPLTTPTSIRLLKLAPLNHTNDSHLAAELIETDIKNPSEYWAVSYVWGRRVNAEKLVCTIGDHTGILHCTGNAADALRRLQHVKKHQYLWLDNICINQNDDKEKQTQIAIMGDIYASASRVCIWLPSDDDWKCNRKFRFLRLSTKFVRASSSQSLRVQLLWPLEILCGRYFLDDLSHISKSPWFSRVWTIQEYAFAKKSYVYVDDGTPLDGTTILQTWICNGPFKLDDIRTVLNVILEYPRHMLFNAESVIIEIRKYKATKPVDKVFSMYSTFATIPEFRSLAIEPDYQRPAEEIFQQFAAGMLQRYRSLSILFGVAGITESNCASWVPDLRISGRVPYQHSSWLPRNGSSPHNIFQVSENGKVLRIAGKIVDKVSVISNVHHPVITQTGKGVDEQNTALLAMLLKWYNLAFKSGIAPERCAILFCYTCGNGNSLVAAVIAQTILLLTQTQLQNGQQTSRYQQWKSDRKYKPGPSLPTELLDHIFQPDRYPYHKAQATRELISFCGPLVAGPEEELAEAFMSLILEKSPSDSTLPDQKDIRQLRTHHRKFQYFTTGWSLAHLIKQLHRLRDREFYVTEKLLIGLTNGHVQDGDLVALIPAMNTAALLRLHDASKSEYKFVGVAEIAELGDYTLHGLPPNSTWKDAFADGSIDFFNLV